MKEQEREQEQDFSFKSLFTPLTNFKAIHWIVVIGTLVFFNSLFNSFVLDDEWQVVNNILIHSLNNLPQFFMGGTFNTGGANVLAGEYYRPLMLTYFSLIYSLFGPNPFPYHFVQIILHIVNTSLVFLVFNRFLRRGISFLLALVFLVHPINQEVVVYVSDTQDVLFFLFGIIAIILSIDGITSIKKAVVINSLFLAALLSKETAVILTPIIIFSPWLSKKKITSLHIVSVLTVVGAYLFIRFNVIQFVTSSYHIFPMMNLSLTERLLHIPAIIFYYLRTFLFPQNLAIQQLWVIEVRNFQQFFLPLIVDIIFSSLVFLLGVYLYRAKRSMRVYFFFLGWFLAGLLIHLQIFPLDMTVATRWFYFPIVGLLGLMGLAIQSVRVKNTRVLKMVYILSIIVILALSLRTMDRNADWKDAKTLYSQDIQIEDNFALRNNLGNEFFKEGRNDEALVHFEKSIEEKPYWSNLYNIGMIYYINKDYQKAEEYLRSSLEHGDYYLAYENLSFLYLFSGDASSAKKNSEEGLEKLPHNATLWYIYGLAEYQLGNRQTAINSMEYSISIDSRDINKAEIVRSRIAILNAMKRDEELDLNKFSD